MSLFAKRRTRNHKSAKLRAADVEKGARTTADVAEAAGLVASFIPGVGGVVNLAAKGVEKGARAVENEAKKAAKKAKNKARRAKSKARKGASARVTGGESSYTGPSITDEIRAATGRAAKKPLSTGMKVGIGLGLVAIGYAVTRRRA